MSVRSRSPQARTYSSSLCLTVLLSWAQPTGEAVAEHPEYDAPEDLANSSQDPVDCRQALPLSPEPAVKVQHLVHKVLTYVDYRAVSGDFQNIDPHPLSPQRVGPPPASKAGEYILARG